MTQDGPVRRGQLNPLGKSIVGLDLVCRFAIVAGIGMVSWQARRSDYLSAVVATPLIGYGIVQLVAIAAEGHLVLGKRSENPVRWEFVVAGGALPRLMWAVSFIRYEHEDHDDWPVVVLVAVTVAVVVAAVTHGIWRRRTQQRQSGPNGSTNLINS